MTFHAIPSYPPSRTTKREGGKRVKKLSLTEWGSIAEIVATIGLVISLIFVGLQINQNTNATSAAAAQAVHGGFSGWYASLQGDPELLAISIKGMRDYSTLSEVERAQYIALFMIFSLNTQDAFNKWRDGALAPELWRGWEVVAEIFYASPGGKSFWDERGYMFGDSYQHYVELDLMQRPPHPKAKPFGAFEIAPGERR
jgi:hypothetical protein